MPIGVGLTFAPGPGPLITFYEAPFSAGATFSPTLNSGKIDFCANAMFVVFTPGASSTSDTSDVVGALLTMF